jgi:radical SAM protein with 4Fe4S-binding SPASM domain
MFKLTKYNAYTLLSQFRTPFKILNDLGMRLSYLFGLKKFPFLPSSLDIESVNNCNFRCPHCQVTHWDKEVSHLQISAFEKVLNQFPSLIWVKLQGMGEPLLNKNLIPMLQLGEKRNIWMSFTTNASLLNHRIASQIATLTKTSVYFSIDGASAEVFESIRVGSRFSVVCENIKSFTSLIKIKNKSRITAWMVLTKQNFHEVEDVVLLVKKLGITKLTLQPFLNNWGKDEMADYIDELKLSPSQIFSDTTDATLAKAQKFAKEQGIKLEIYRRDFYTKHRKCPWPWKSAYICTNGDVVPCPILADSDTVKMGNIYEQDFREIWNSEQYQELRRCHINYDLPKYCQHCYLNTEH